MIERALKYFNYYKALAIGFLCSLILSFVCAIIYPIIMLVLEGSGIFFLFVGWLYALLAAVVCVWLEIKDRIILALMVVSVAFSLIKMVCLIIFFKTKDCLDSHVLIRLMMSFVASIAIVGAVFIVWNRRKRYRKCYKPLFITGLALCGILNLLDLYSTLFFLIAAVVLLWIPLDKWVFCRKCGFRNVKVSGFCGGCGNKLL